MSFGASWGKRDARKAREAPYELSKMQSRAVLWCGRKTKAVQRETAVVQSSSDSN